MIEVKELVAMQPKSERIDLMDELLTLQDLRTRIRLLINYIHDEEHKAAKEALEYPRRYNTNIEQIQIPTSQVLWLLGYGHQIDVIAMFDEAKQELKKQIEEEEAGEKDA